MEEEGDKVCAGPAGDRFKQVSWGQRKPRSKWDLLFSGTWGRGAGELEGGLCGLQGNRVTGRCFKLSAAFTGWCVVVTKKIIKILSNSSLTVVK